MTFNLITDLYFIIRWLLHTVLLPWPQYKKFSQEKKIRNTWIHKYLLYYRPRQSLLCPLPYLLQCLPLVWPVLTITHVMSNNVININLRRFYSPIFCLFDLILTLPGNYSDWSYSFNMYIGFCYSLVSKLFNFNKKVSSLNLFQLRYTITRPIRFPVSWSRL